MLLGSCSLERMGIASVRHHNAFLHGDLDEEVYVKLPLGFTCSSPSKACRLKNLFMDSSRLCSSGLLNFAISCMNMNSFIRMLSTHFSPTGKAHFCGTLVV